MLCRLIIHFFLLLRQMLLYGCDTYIVLIFPWIFGCLQFGVFQSSRCEHLCTISVRTCAFISFGYKLRRINGLLGNCMFNFLRNCQSRCTIYIVARCVWVPGHLFLCQPLVLSGFIWALLVCVVLPHLHLHFPSDWWCWVSFYALYLTLYIFFGRMSV